MTIVILLTIEDAKNLVRQRVHTIDNENFYNIYQVYEFTNMMFFVKTVTLLFMTLPSFIIQTTNQFFYRIILKQLAAFNI